MEEVMTGELNATIFVKKRGGNLGFSKLHVVSNGVGLILCSLDMGMGRRKRFNEEERTK